VFDADERFVTLQTLPSVCLSVCVRQPAMTDDDYTIAATYSHIHRHHTLDMSLVSG